MSEKGPEQRREMPDDLEALSQQLQSRRSAEKQGGNIEARTQLLLEALEDGAFARWREAGVPVSIWPDANGLRLDAGPAGERGVHSHIPYEYISPELAAKLRTERISEQQKVDIPVHDSWVDAFTEGGYAKERFISEHAREIEFEIRVAEAGGRTDLLFDLYAAQDLSFSASVRRAGSSSMDSRETEGQIEADDHEADALKYLYCYTDAITNNIDAERSRVEYHLSRPTIQHFIRAERDVSDQAADWDKAQLSDRVQRLLQFLDAANAGAQEYQINELTRAEPRLQSWKGLRESHQPASFSKGVFETRRQNLHGNVHNAEVSKVLTILLEEYTPEELAQHGIQVTRAPFNKELEFVGVWTAHGYNHVLIDPKKHIRSETAKANYESISAIARSDFEAFEGLLLPYKHFRALAREVTSIVRNYGRDQRDLEEEYYHDVVKRLQNAIEGSLSVITTEIHPDQLRKLSTLTERALAGLLSHPTGWGPLEHLSTYLDELLKEYDQIFVGRSAETIVEERLPSPERIEFTYDQSFVDALPDEVRNKESVDFDCCRDGTPATVVRSGSAEHGIPYALEAKALRALKVSKGPTLLSITGAQFANIEGEQTAQIQELAEAEARILAKWQANAFMQGTNSGGIAAAKVRAHRELSKELDDQVNPPQLIGIEPGKDTFYPSNDWVDTDNLTNTYPVLTSKTVVTPYHAGWADLSEAEKATLRAQHGDDLETYLAEQYYEHITLRQAIINRASEGYPKVLSITNGGGWSVPEAIAALRDNFELITLCDQGRLGTLLCHLHDSLADWQKLEQDSELIAAAQETIAKTVPGQFRSELANTLPILQERGLAELMRLLKTARVRSASLGTYATVLDQAFADQSAVATTETRDAE